MMWGVEGYMKYFEEFSTFYQWFFAGLMILSMAICGGIFEKKKWVFFAEYGRLVGVAFTLNVFYYTKYIDWFTIVVVASAVGLAVFYTWFSISLSKNYKALLVES